MKTIFFKIISNENENIYQEGYVEVPDDVEELPEWFYYNQEGSAQPQIFTNHDEIGLTQIGATPEQEAELESFWKALDNDVIFIDDVILTAEEDENRTYVRNDITIIVNEGAKMECEVTETNDGDYWGMLDFSFNRESLRLDEDLMEELVEEIDSTYAGEGRYEILDDTSIACEISKNHYGVYEDDEYYIEETESIMKEHINNAEKVFAKQLVRNLRVYGIAGVIYEEKHGKLDESGCDKFANNWEQAFEDFDVSELYVMSEEDVERIIKEDGDADD